MTEPIWVFLRFDTEDYVTPESNDALAYICRELSRRDIRATFPLVGEKLRYLRSQGRTDCIHLLHQHCVGYHTNLHSQHPTSPEYLENMQWDEGIQRFEEEERPGLIDVTEEFGPVSSFTQAGGTWVPQAYPALRRWKIPFFYSEGWNGYVDFDQRPFWMGSRLSWAREVTVGKLFSVVSSGLGVEGAWRLISTEIEEQQQRGRSPVTLQLVCHPTELVTQIFWDQVNFGQGKQTEPALRRPAPLKKPADVEADKAAFEAIIDRLRGLPEVAFLTAEDLVGRIHPEKTCLLTERDAMTVVDHVAATEATGSLDFLATRVGAWSAAELFELVLRLFVHVWEFETFPGELKAVVADGPVHDAAADPAFSTGAVPTPSLHRAATAALESLSDRRAVPGFVGVDGRRFGPGQLVYAVAKVLQERMRNSKWDREIHLRAEPALSAVKWVKPADRQHWDWPIFPPGFRAPRLLRYTHKMAWTLKPARLDQD